MQSEEPASEITKPKSATGFPNKLPTYVVGFALKETYDDLVTAQQMICNKRSPQDSTNTITPTNSLKMFESEQDDKLNQISDASENKINDENENIEKNYLIASELNSSESQIENTIQKEDINYNKTKTSLEDSTIDEIPQNYKDVNQPEVIFNATNYPRRYEHSKFLKRKSKTYKNVKTKYNKFKCKTPKTSINNRLEKYYERAKQNSVNCGQIQQRFSNISTVVSRSRVLKKVLAKENLLEETELISISNFSNLDRNNDGSLVFQPSTLRVQTESFISNASGNTLTHKSSTTSPNNEDTYDVNAVKSSSFIKISPENMSPYKTDVINVAVAVAYEYESKVITSDETTPKNAKLIYSDSLVSSETLTLDMTALTSQVLSDFGRPKTDEQVILNEMSNDTLINKQSSFNISSDDDTYDMARTSSEFNESNNSTVTLKSNLEKRMCSEKHGINDIGKSKMKKQTQPTELQTVADLDYSEISLCTSFANVLNTAQNNFVAENENQNYQIIAKNMGDHGIENKVNTNILKQQFNERDVSPAIMYDNIHKQAHFKAIQHSDANSQQKKVLDETKHYPSDLPEMWDRLILALDVAFKKLEESVTDNIIREMKKTIVDLKLDLQPLPQTNVDLERGETIAEEPPASSKVLAQEHEIDECLQCNLVQNKVIDQIMLKLSSQGPKIMEPERSVKSLQKLKPKLFRDYFEVLKPLAVAGPGVLVDKADTVTVSTVIEEFDRFHRLRMLFCGPLHFIRENVFVITSVPAFFVVLLFVYGLLMITIKPW